MLVFYKDPEYNITGPLYVVAYLKGGKYTLKKVSSPVHPIPVQV